MSPRATPQFVTLSNSFLVTPSNSLICHLEQLLICHPEQREGSCTRPRFGFWDVFRGEDPSGCALRMTSEGSRHRKRRGIESVPTSKAPRHRKCPDIESAAASRAPRHRKRSGIGRIATSTCPLRASPPQARSRVTAHRSLSIAGAGAQSKGQTACPPELRKGPALCHPEQLLPCRPEQLLNLSP